MASPGDPDGGRFLRQGPCCPATSSSSSSSSPADGGQVALDPSGQYAGSPSRSTAAVAAANAADAESPIIISRLTGEWERRRRRRECYVFFSSSKSRVFVFLRRQKKKKFTLFSPFSPQQAASSTPARCPWAGREPWASAGSAHLPSTRRGGFFSTDAYGAPLTHAGGGKADTLATALLRASYAGSQGEALLSLEQALPLRPSWLNFNRVRVRAEKRASLAALGMPSLRASATARGGERREREERDGSGEEEDRKNEKKKGKKKKKKTHLFFFFQPLPFLSLSPPPPKKKQAPSSATSRPTRPFLSGAPTPSAATARARWAPAGPTPRRPPSCCSPCPSVGGRWKGACSPTWARTSRRAPRCPGTRPAPAGNRVPGQGSASGSGSTLPWGRSGWSALCRTGCRGGSTWGSDLMDKEFSFFI